MRASALGAILIGAVLLAAASSARADRVRIVILPIVIHSADPNSAYVSEGLADMISSRLQRTGEFDVLRTGSQGATTDLRLAVARGREAGGDWVLFGAFTQFGDGASLDLQCAELGSHVVSHETEERHIFIQAGTMGEIIPKLDVLVERVAAHVGANDGAGPVEAVEAPAPDGEADWAATDVVEEPIDGYTSAEELEALRQRVEALERTVYEATAEADAYPDDSYDAELEDAIPEEASAALDEVPGDPLPES